MRAVVAGFRGNITGGLTTSGSVNLGNEDEAVSRLTSAARAATGDLGDCRKVFFRSARYRIVYRLEPNQITPKRVNVSSTRRETA